MRRFMQPMLHIFLARDLSRRAGVPPSRLKSRSIVLFAKGLDVMRFRKIESDRRDRYGCPACVAMTRGA
jgi:hypothetical protein